MKSERPLFIALRTEYFEQFKAGTKTIEYRRHERMWNARACRPGRRVVLSHGYSGRGRLDAVIVRFETKIMDSEIYGKAQELALIHIKLVDATD